MAINLSELKWYGSAVMPDDDVATAIGGAIDTSKKVEFADSGPFQPFGLAQIVSSTSVDTTQGITVSFRLALTPTAVSTEARTLNGLTPVALSNNIERILKAVKNAITVGDLAVESQTAILTGTLVGTGGVDQATLPAGADAVAALIPASVIRITAGTGINQIREIILYQGTPTRVFFVSRAWDVVPDGTSQFRISKGMVFEKTPFEIFQVRRPFFNSSADVPGGVVKNYFEKIFARNTNTTGSLATSTIIEAADLTNECTFGVASTTSDTGTNGGGNNRQVAPAAITFDNANKGVPGNTLGPMVIPGAATTSYIGVWLKLTRQPGDPALNQPVTMRLQGQTI